MTLIIATKVITAIFGNVCNSLKNFNAVDPCKKKYILQVHFWLLQCFIMCIVWSRSLMIGNDNVCSQLVKKKCLQKLFFPFLKIYVRFQKNLIELQI